jgi:hypothetical protein
MTLEESLRLEKLSLLVGTMIGQISELLTQLKGDNINIHGFYISLLDILNSAAMQVYDLYYKDKK